MGRGGRRLVAAGGGVLINGLILTALVLIEAPTPRVEEPPVLVLDLERPQRQRAQARKAPPSPSRATSLASAASERATPDAAPKSASEAARPLIPSVDPQWRVDPNVIDDWKIAEGAPQGGWGRYRRACQGLSNEHMTPDEKERCHGGWSAPKDKRPSPDFVGPIDETTWETPGPRQAPDAHELHQRRCRDYRRGRTPGFSERNLASTGAPAPSLGKGGCF
jgi:hypothetical protein